MPVFSSDHQSSYHIQTGYSPNLRLVTTSSMNSRNPANHQVSMFRMQSNGDLILHQEDNIGLNNIAN